MRRLPVRRKRTLGEASSLCQIELLEQRVRDDQKQIEQLREHIASTKAQLGLERTRFIALVDEGDDKYLRRRRQRGEEQRARTAAAEDKRVAVEKQREHDRKTQEVEERAEQLRKELEREHERDEMEAESAAQRAEHLAAEDWN